MKILLACDRTGGHVFPAITLAKELVKNNLVSRDNLCFFAPSSLLLDHIKAQGFTVYGKALNIRNFIVEGVVRFYEAVYLISSLRPEMIIGFGGRDSFLLLLLGSILGIKTAIYEPNIKMGKANKILAWFVKEVFYGFPESSKGYKKSEHYIGIPLRETIRQINKEEAKINLGFNNQPVILCFGGSQGAKFVNDIFINLVKDFSGDYQIIHLTGKNDYTRIKESYKQINKTALVIDFSDKMEDLYSAADLVISRSGAFTLAEVIYYKLPAIFIPHPQGGGHQRENAYYLRDRGLSYVFLQNNFSQEEFNSLVKEIILDNQRLEKIKNNFKNIQLGVISKDFCDKIWKKLEPVKI